MKTFKVFLLMNELGEYLGKNGNWELNPNDARMYSASEALLLLRALPRTSIITARVGYAPENTRALPGFQSSLSQAA